MDSSEIYNLIENCMLNKWLEELEKKDINGYKKDVDNCKKKLCDVIDEEQKKLLNLFERAIGYYWEDIYYAVNIRILNLGIKIGMQLRQAFDSQD